jgi:hypothetical protein
MSIVERYKISRDPIIVSGINGNTTTVGSIKVEIGIEGYKVNELFHVVEDHIIGPFDLYLGEPFLTNNKCVINYDYLTFSNRFFNVPMSVEILQADFQEPHPVRVSSIKVATNKIENHQSPINQGVQPHNEKQIRVSGNTEMIRKVIEIRDRENDKHDEDHTNKQSPSVREVVLKVKSGGKECSDPNILNKCGVQAFGRTVKTDLPHLSKGALNSVNKEKEIQNEKRGTHKKTRGNRGRKKKKNEQIEIVDLRIGNKVYLEQDAKQGPPIAMGPLIVEEITKDYVILKRKG